MMVCNAGLTRDNDLLNLESSLIDLSTSSTTAPICSAPKVAANDMVKRDEKGNIIFIASARGIRAYPEDSIYGGMKAALIRSVESMALDMGQYGIRVNCVAPALPPYAATSPWRSFRRDRPFSRRSP